VHPSAAVEMGRWGTQGGLRRRGWGLSDRLARSIRLMLLSPPLWLDSAAVLGTVTPWAASIPLISATTLFVAGSMTCFVRHLGHLLFINDKLSS
jgi:hypothetical protein